MQIEHHMTYKADDGTEFSSQAECLVYESKSNPLRIKPETVSAILFEDSDAAKAGRDFLQRLTRLARLGEVERGVYVPQPKGKHLRKNQTTDAEEIRQAAE